VHIAARTAPGKAGTGAKFCTGVIIWSFLSMTMRFRGGAALAVLLGLAVTLPGCTRLVTRQGYLVDETLMSSVQPGTDNRDSVMGTLGRPSFVGQFGDRDWYYVARVTRQLAFANPTPSAQTILHVSFDAKGNVAAVERRGLEQVASIKPADAKTPTLGRDRSFFEELFGNIGTVGQGGTGASTADNPQ
jgi:outer membrane protein assembly factor BamE (lipoprotein component of BamABCDE complex)